MFVFDLTHDRMASQPVTVVADVQAAVIFYQERYARAARGIGLTNAEYAEFERRVIDGDARPTMLPTHLDAMAGSHHGRIYAIRDVRVRSGERAFVVALSDGKRVYVPQVCGNLSVVKGRPARVVAVHNVPVRHSLARRAPRPLVAAAVAVPQAAPLQPDPAPAAVAVAPAVVPAVATVAKSRFGFVPFFAWLAGGISSITSSNTNGNAPPPCSANQTSDQHVCAQ